jgi:uncharacterized membrane protein HdeD (DUF308 family)
MGKNSFFNNKQIITHGLLPIVFGVIVIVYPGISVAVLATFLGLFLLLGGVILSIDAYRNNDFKKNGMQNFILGILSIVLAIVILSYPKESVAAFLFLSAGIWAIINGSVLIWSYIRKGIDSKRKTSTLVFGIISLFFGMYMALQPVEGTHAIAVILGIYAILYGIHAFLYPAHK